MSRAGAWVLDIGPCRVAVGVREQVHLMHEPAAAEVAATPPHCRHVIFWNGRCVPVMDLGRWLYRTPAPGLVERRHLGIYAYVPHGESTLDFGALWLAGPPQRVEVDDADSAHLPADGGRWTPIAPACFADAKGAVPVLDLTKIFSKALADS